MEMKNINSMPRRDDVVFPWKERNMNVWLDKLHGPPDKKETAALAGTKRDGGSGKHHTNNANQNTHDMQAACRAIEAGLTCLPDACDMAFILRRRLDLPERIWLGASSMMTLTADTAEQLSEAVLHDLRAGEPVAPFTSIRDAAASWTTYASRAECCHYLAAIWGELHHDDRQRFIRRAI